MSDSRWIIVPNWERFQHYGVERTPIWVKNYISLLHKDEYVDLTPAERGVLHGIWLAYAEAKGRIRTDRDLNSALRSRIPTRALESLSHAGFIEFSASKPLLLNLLDHPRARDRADYVPPGVQTKRRRAERWIRNGAASEVPAERLGDVIADEFEIDDPRLVADLVAQASEWRQEQTA